MKLNTLTRLVCTQNVIIVVTGTLWGLLAQLVLWYSCSADMEIRAVTRKGEILKNNFLCDYSFFRAYNCLTGIQNCRPYFV